MVCRFKWIIVDRWTWLAKLSSSSSWSLFVKSTKDEGSQWQQQQQPQREYATQNKKSCEYTRCDGAATWLVTVDHGYLETALSMFVANFILITFKKRFEHLWFTCDISHRPYSVRITFERCDYLAYCKTTLTLFWDGQSVSPSNVTRQRFPLIKQSPDCLSARVRSKDGFIFRSAKHQQTTGLLNARAKQNASPFNSPKPTAKWIMPFALNANTIAFGGRRQHNFDWFQFNHGDDHRDQRQW